MAKADLRRPFAAIIFDWDGTAVASRREEPEELVALGEALLRLSVWIVVVAGTKLEHIERRLVRCLSAAARRRLTVCTNRGSEVWRFDRAGDPVRRYLRRSTAGEERALTATAEALRDCIVNATDLDIEIVYDRLNRRKVDLIPEPEWSDPPKARIAELLHAVESRLLRGGIEHDLSCLGTVAHHLAAENGLPAARITSDAKHIEIGLTDKGDSAAWVRRHILEPHGIAPDQVLIAGDEFGCMLGLPGSDARMCSALPGAIAISVGVEPNGVSAEVLQLPGGPATVRALLVEQVRMHYERKRSQGAARAETARRNGFETWAAAVLEPAADPAWVLAEAGYEPAVEHEVESRLAFSNGFVGIRAALDDPTPASRPRTYLAGLYETAEGAYGVPALVSLPDWLGFRVKLDGEPLAPASGEMLSLDRTVDLRRGLLLSDWRQRTSSGKTVHVRALRAASESRRRLALQLARVDVDGPAVLGLEERFDSSLRTAVREARRDRLHLWRSGRADHAVVLASNSSLVSAGPTVQSQVDGTRWTWAALPGAPAVFRRIAAFSHSRSASEPGAEAAAALDRARRLGFRRLLSAHVRRWQERWDASDIEIGGDPEAHQALRFAIYHLISAADPEGDRASIGARALTGDAYMGHVFWDTDVFLLPFYVHTWPQAARALLSYRFRTLPAARERAAAFGYRGALYPWESADTGEDVTPSFGARPDGQVVRIETGRKAHHISAAIAYAVWNYWQRTGDNRFLLAAGAEMILETARFWASRARLEADTRYHIRDVIGPDEYHEGVDDNAYTNVMARWNLQRALEIDGLLQERWPAEGVRLRERLDLRPQELELWQEVAERLVTGRAAGSDIFEQFAGLFGLEDIDLSAFEPRTAPIDILLGRERIQASQVIKQADVLMILHLLWDALPRAVREANFRHYEPRCAHGSSLSPPVHALLAARLGDMALAERYFRETMHIDLGDTQGRVAGGVHIGALGGLWQAAVFGFAGVSFGGDQVHINPRLPEKWEQVRFPVQWRGRSLRIDIRRDPPMVSAVVERGRPVTIGIGEQSRHLECGERWAVRLAGPDQGKEAAS